MILSLAILCMLSAGVQAEVVISGQVTWALTGEPIAAAEVALNGGADGTTMTSAGGTYGFTGLNAGDYEISVTKESYVDVVLPSEFYADGTYEIDFEMENEQVDLPMLGYADLGGNTAHGGMVVGDLGYFTEGASGLRIVDVGDPASMPTIGSVTLDSPAYNVLVNGNAAYVGTSVGFTVVNVNDPANPTVSTEMTVGATGGFVMAANYLFAASETNGLIVLGAIDPLNPQFMTAYATPDNALDIDFAGNYVFMAIGDGGLAVINVSNPGSPSLVAEMDLGGFASAIEIASNFAIITLSDVGLAAVDISNPANPVLVSTLAAAGSSDHLTIWGCYVFVANATEGVRAYYIGDRSNMTEVGYSLLDGNTNNVAYSDDVVYVSKVGQIIAFDGSAFLGGFMENAAVLTLAGTQTQIPAGGGTVMYDATVESRCHMCHNPPYTVPNCYYKTYVQLPNNDLVGPLSSRQFTLAGYMNVTVTDLTLEVPANAPSGTYTFLGEVSKPPGFVPTATGIFTFNKAGTVSGNGYEFDPDEWLSGSNFAVANESAQVVTPATFEMQAAYPNPFNPTTSLSVNLPETADLSVIAYNVMGQQVASLAQGQHHAGEHSFVFDATELASGLYFIRATVPGQLDQTQKVMLVR
ncbi:carboxypeptidase regulatory-like domain-containing protein [bacterium]|nr:carboxypeptidase regulatory-like domain-containing protein [bacterium]